MAFECFTLEEQDNYKELFGILSGREDLKESIDICGKFNRLCLSLNAERAKRLGIEK